VNLRYRCENDAPVCIPNVAPIPNTRKNRASGIRPAGGGPFFLSDRASTAITKTTVARNSSKNAETFVI